ncbi:TolB family protein [Candidatus Poriferisodalis sp.]|uniref:TolB family protein n=1 Tax=Candidatus Poriferisodalis sp. TaxID=3101277 RepID=UPI003B020DF9
MEPVGGEPSASEDPRGPTRPRRGWWLVIALVVVVGAAAVVVSLPAGPDPLTDDAAEGAAAEGDEAAETSDAALPEAQETADEASADLTTPAEQSDDDLAAGEPPPADAEDTEELSEAFGEPEHPVSGVEPYIPSRVRPAELGPPAEVCLGTLPAYRIQLPLRFASTKPEGIDHVSWSPDCRRMVFRVGPALWLAGGDGTGDMPFLTAQYGLSDPAWSPDGEWIAFSQDAIVDGERTSHILLVQPDGLGLSQITDGVVLDRDPAWSPDGKRLVFSRRARVSGDGAGEFDHFFVAVDIATGDEQVLASGVGPDSRPSWSPDGELLTYGSGITLMALRPRDGVARVMLADAAGRGAAWSPDGSRVAAFRHWHDDRTMIVVSDLPGLYPGDEHVIEVEGFEPFSPSAAPSLQWSADGRRVFFYAADTPGSHWAYSVVVPEPARPPEYWAALATVEDVLQAAGYSEVSAQHSVDVEAEFVMRGRAAATAVEAWVAFDRTEPRGVFDAIENTHSDMPAITRGDDRNGVWFTCNNLYGEVLAQSLQEADALAATLIPALCPAN